MTILNRDEIERLRKTFEDYKPVTGYFEREILLPQVKGRTNYLISIFKNFQEIATDEKVATHIDEALRRVADERRLPITGKEPSVGRQYLTAISDQLENEYIKPFSKLLTEELSDIERLSKDHAATSNVLNIVYNDLQSIVGCREVLFKYHMKDFPNLKNLKTGEVLLGEPFEASLSLMPFDTRLNEVVNVVETLLTSIKEWGKSMQEQRNKNFEIILKMSEIKSIKESQKYQIILIVVSVVFIVAAFYFNIWLESFQKGRVIDSQEVVISGYKEKVLELEKKSSNLESENIKLKLEFDKKNEK